MLLNPRPHELVDHQILNSPRFTCHRHAKPASHPLGGEWGPFPRQDLVLATPAELVRLGARLPANGPNISFALGVGGYYGRYAWNHEQSRSRACMLARVIARKSD